jgi:hypothetical protein
MFVGVARRCFHKSSFSSKLTSKPNKLEVFYVASLSSIVKCNALAYWAHSYVTKKMECCEYGPGSLTKRGALERCFILVGSGLHD